MTFNLIIKLSNFQVKIITAFVLILIITLPPIESYHDRPTVYGSGYSYVDSGGQFINVKFGRSISSPVPLSYMSKEFYPTRYGPLLTANSLAITPVKELFKPSQQQADEEVPYTNGQLEEFYKFLKEAAEEDANETLTVQSEMDNLRDGSVQTYVSVKMGKNGYNYQY